MKPVVLTIITISWAASLFGAYRLGHVISNHYDYPAPTQLRPIIASWSDAQVSTNDWLRNPRYRQFGRYVVLRPQDSTRAGLMIGVIGRPPLPVIYITEGDKSERPDVFMLYDAAGNTVSSRDKNGDGIFDVLDMTTTNGAYRDVGLTGSWKFKAAPVK